MPVTQRQLAETISEMKMVARDLREASEGEPLVETRGKIVLASVGGLRAHADFLDRVARELLELVDPALVEVPLGEPPSSDGTDPSQG